MTKKIKIISALATLSFVSLSLSLLSLNFSPKTGVDAITKTGLSDLFAGQTDLGSFSSTPSLEGILTRGKENIVDFHNEKANTFIISNQTNNGCTLIANDGNYYYSGSVVLFYTIDAKISLSSLFPLSVIANNAWNSKVSFKGGGEKNEKNTLAIINHIFANLGYGISNLNQITGKYKTYGGTYGDGIFTIEAINSPNYYGSVDIPYTNTISPTNMISYTSPSPFVVSASSYYSTTTRAGWFPFSQGSLTSENEWLCADNQYQNAWLKIDLSTAQNITKYLIRPRVVYNSPVSWTIEGSNDDVNFTVIDTRINQDLPKSKNTEYICNAYTPNVYRYFRIKISQFASNERGGLSRLFLY